MSPQIDVAGLVRPERAEIVFQSDDGKAAVFEMGPLERGYGHTLGNAVRRALLSSLRGASVWAFRIPGVVHQHQTIPSVVEDVHQVIQNLKYLVVSVDDDADGAVLEIRASKSGPVSASMIRGPASVTIHDPAHHILTLEDDVEINIELHVGKGRGFVRAEEHPVPDNAPVDLVPIDAIYNPVLRANFSVEDARVGQRTDYDKLTVRVETDGSMEPQRAIANAAELVRMYFGFIIDGPPTFSDDPLPVPPHLARLLKTPIADVAELTANTRNTLQRAMIATLGELVALTREEILELHGIGDSGVEDIAEFYAAHGLAFGMKLDQREDGRVFLPNDSTVSYGG